MEREYSDTVNEFSISVGSIDAKELPELNDQEIDIVGEKNIQKILVVDDQSFNIKAL